MVESLFTSNPRVKHVTPGFGDLAIRKEVKIPPFRVCLFPSLVIFEIRLSLKGSKSLTRTRIHYIITQLLSLREKKNTRSATLVLCCPAVPAISLGSKTSCQSDRSLRWPTFFGLLIEECVQCPSKQRACCCST